MTPARIIEVFKAIAEDYDCIFFAGVTAEFLRVTVEAEASQGKTFVVIDLQGLNIKDDFSANTSKARFTLHVIQRDNPDSVSQPADNLSSTYDSIQTICLECYNTWIDILHTLRSDVQTASDYLARYSDLSVVSSDATYFIKPKLLGMMSGIFVNIEASGIIEC